jgi:hypothetical protein
MRNGRGCKPQTHASCAAAARGLQRRAPWLPTWHASAAPPSATPSRPLRPAPLRPACSNVTSKQGRRAVDLLEPWLIAWARRQRDASLLPPRLFTVGRLDVNTSGLVLVTNDGQWGNRVIHPSAGLTKARRARAGRARQRGERKDGLGRGQQRRRPTPPRPPCRNHSPLPAPDRPPTPRPPLPPARASPRPPPPTGVHCGGGDDAHAAAAGRAAARRGRGGRAVRAARRRGRAEGTRPRRRRAPRPHRGVGGQKARGGRRRQRGDMAAAGGGRRQAGAAAARVAWPRGPTSPPRAAPLCSPCLRCASSSPRRAWSCCRSTARASAATGCPGTCRWAATREFPRVVCVAWAVPLGGPGARRQGGRRARPLLRQPRPALRDGPHPPARGPRAPPPQAAQAPRGGGAAARRARGGVMRQSEPEWGAARAPRLRQRRPRERSGGVSTPARSNAAVSGDQGQGLSEGTAPRRDPGLRAARIDRAPARGAPSRPPPPPAGPAPGPPKLVATWHALHSST